MAHRASNPPSQAVHNAATLNQQHPVLHTPAQLLPAIPPFIIPNNLGALAPGDSPNPDPLVGGYVPASPEFPGLGLFDDFQQMDENLEDGYDVGDELLIEDAMDYGNHQVAAGAQNEQQAHPGGQNEERVAVLNVEAGAVLPTVKSRPFSCKNLYKFQPEGEPAVIVHHDKIAKKITTISSLIHGPYTKEVYLEQFKATNKTRAQEKLNMSCPTYPFTAEDTYPQFSFCGLKLLAYVTGELIATWDFDRQIYIVRAVFDGENMFQYYDVAPDKVYMCIVEASTEGLSRGEVHCTKLPEKKPRLSGSLLAGTTIVCVPRQDNEPHGISRIYFSDRGSLHVQTWNGYIFEWEISDEDARNSVWLRRSHPIAGDGPMQVGQNMVLVPALEHHG